MIFGVKKNRDKDNEQRDLIIAFKHVFITTMGRKVLFDLLNRFHVLNSHKGDSFSEGQRSVVLYILQQNHINLDDFDKLLKGELE
jgi:hypothetical protein